MVRLAQHELSLLSGSQVHLPFLKSREHHDRDLPFKTSSNPAYTPDTRLSNGKVQVCELSVNAYKHAFGFL